MAELRLSHTRQWDDPELLKERAGLSNVEDPLEFVFEISTHSEDWLVGGQRRALFSTREHELRTFSIILIPLRVGHLLLPQVDVRPKPSPGRPMSRGSAEPQMSEPETTVTCETDCQSLSESVIVIPDVGSTTVELHFAGQQVAESLMTQFEPRADAFDEPEP
jgi:trafficking protein particle complex subunit 10